MQDTEVNEPVVNDDEIILAAADAAKQAMADAEAALNKAIADEAEAKQAFEAKPTTASHGKFAVATQVVANLTRELEAVRDAAQEPIKAGRRVEASRLVPELDQRARETHGALASLQKDLSAAHAEYRRALQAWRKNLQATLSQHNDACTRLQVAARRAGVDVADRASSLAYELQQAATDAQRNGVTLNVDEHSNRIEARITA